MNIEERFDKRIKEHCDYAGDYVFLTIYEDIKAFIKKEQADLKSEILNKIKTDESTFGITDRDNKGGAILIDDLERIIKTI